MDIRIVSEDSMEQAEREEGLTALTLARELVATEGMPVCPSFLRTPEEITKYGIPSDILPLIRPVVSSEREAKGIPAAFSTAESRKASFLTKYRRDNQQYFPKWAK